MFRDTYQGELEYLQQLCDEFGRERPALASMLGRNADPATTRLVQNLAFLFARLRQRLDDDLPEVIHPVLEGLCPWLLRPLPSATILELSPDSALKEVLDVPAGSLFGSRPVDGAPCLFQSSSDVAVVPWALERVEVGAERLEVRLTLAVFEGVKLDFARVGALRLFIATAPPAALDVRSLLLRHAVEVRARALRAPGAPPPKGGAADVLLASGPGVAVGAAPPPRPPDAESFAALAQLRAYFAWPAHHAFVEIPSIDRLAALGPDLRRVELVIRLDKPVPRLLTLDASQIRLHAVPSMNVHRLPPLNVPLRGTRCAVRPPRAGAEVYAIERVTLVRPDLASERAEPWAQFFPPVLDEAGRPPLRYETHRVPSVTGPELDVSLSFVGLAPAEARARETASPDAEDVASVDLELLVIDGARASRLGAGDVCVPVAASPALVAFRNVTPVSRAAPPSLEADRMWRWFQLLKATLPQLCDAEHLARALALANVAAAARWPEAKPDAERFAGILAVRRARLKRPDRDEVAAGARIEVTVDASVFTGAGDLDAFGETLGPLFASTLRAHEWIELALLDARGELLFEYPACFGTREGL